MSLALLPKAFAAQTKKPLNFVVVLTDDQRWDTLWAMPLLQKTLIRQGVTFTNAFISTPICCPTRASLLSGGFYPKNTGVLSNVESNGLARFRDTQTIATVLKDAGYHTGLFGKYLNGYADILPYIPPGWDEWAGVPEVSYAKNSWMSFQVAVGSGSRAAAKGESTTVNRYMTDYLTDRAVAFIKDSGERPFFLYYSPMAPHVPADPAPGDEKLFSDFQWRGRGFKMTPMAGQGDGLIRNQLRSLQAVDRGVAALFEEIKKAGALDRTVFFFTSDNGHLWGEHGVYGKGYPYEESIRVPLVVMAPGIASRKEDKLAVSNLDIGPTIFDLAGIEHPTDGMSLMPLLRDPSARWREEALLQFYATKGWSSVRTSKWKYVKRTDVSVEFYDIEKDPYELENLAGERRVAAPMAALSRINDDNEGLMIIGQPPQAGSVGQKYSYQLKATGGRRPYSWTVMKNPYWQTEGNHDLPEGLVLDKASGLIHGIPEKALKRDVWFSVESSDLTQQARQPQVFRTRRFFEINTSTFAPSDR